MHEQIIDSQACSCAQTLLGLTVHYSSVTSTVDFKLVMQLLIGWHTVRNIDPFLH